MVDKWRGLPEDFIISPSEECKRPWENESVIRERIEKKYWCTCIENKG